ENGNTENGVRAEWQGQHIHNADQHESPAEAPVTKRLQDLAQSAAFRLLARADLCEAAQCAAPSLVHVLAAEHLDLQASNTFSGSASRRRADQFRRKAFPSATMKSRIVPTRTATA